MYNTRNEIKTLLALALPIMGTQLAQTGMSFVDTLMAGSLSEEDLGAVAVASSLIHPILLLLLGTLFAFTPIVAHLFGGKRQQDVPEAVQSALWVAIVIALIGFLITRNLHPIFEWMEVAPALIPKATGYLEGFAWGLPAIVVYQVMRSLNEGIGNTTPILFVAILGLLANIPANYIFMHGLFGLPEMGGAGCGWASALIMWLTGIAMTLQVLFSRKHQDYKIFDRFYRPNPKRIKELMQLGIPMGFSIFVEVSLFGIIALFVARLGTTAVAGHQVTLNFTSLVFMIPMSLSLAITVRVGQLLGAERFAQARHAAWTGVGVSLLLATFSSTLMMTFAEQIAGFYTTEQKVIGLASHLILFAAFFQFSDALQVAANGALRGYKDTRGPLMITLFSFWGIGIPLGYYLGLTEQLVAKALGPAGFWIGLIVGLSVAAALLLGRLVIIMKRSKLNEAPVVG